MNYYVGEGQCGKVHCTIGINSNVSLLGKFITHVVCYNQTVVDRIEKINIADSVEEVKLLTIHVHTLSGMAHPQHARIGFESSVAIFRFEFKSRMYRCFA